MCNTLQHKSKEPRTLRLLYVTDASASPIDSTRARELALPQSLELR